MIGTSRPSFDEKVIYLCYRLESPDFYWLIAELDPEHNIAFGYANLNDDQQAEWGYINIREIIESGAILDRAWTPCTFTAARLRVATHEGAARTTTFYQPDWKLARDRNNE